MRVKVRESVTQVALASLQFHSLHSWLSSHCNETEYFFSLIHP